MVTTVRRAAMVGALISLKPVRWFVITVLSIQKFGRLSIETIDRQAALDVTRETVFVEYEDDDQRKEESIILQTKAAIRDRIKALPPVYVPVINVGDMISREAASDELSQRYIIMDNPHYIGYNAGLDEAQKVIKALSPVQPTITHEQAIDYLHETGWLQNHDRILTESKIVPPVQLKNGTLIIPLNESDFKSVKRIMLDNKPWCRMFYEDVPGEAHWIKKYTPDDGEIYECDNCGVTWQFNDGGPEENEAFFCPKCGFKMMPKEEEEADGQE